MIKSGLVNQKRGGGFEQGYPSQKYPKGRDEFIRPYVNNSDPTILRKSEYSDPMAYKAVTPSPIQYNDIFRKKPTPDERLYILKQIQQGLDKVQKGILGKIPGGPVVAVPSATAPSATHPTDEVGQTIGAPPAGPPGGGGGEGILIDDMPDLGVATPTSEGGGIYDTSIPAGFGRPDPRQTDGVDEANAALATDERNAVPLTMPAALDPVKEDVVGEPNGIVAPDLNEMARNQSMPGSFPASTETSESKPEVIQTGNRPPKPTTDGWDKRSENAWKKAWNKMSPAKKAYYTGYLTN